MLPAHRTGCSAGVRLGKDDGRREFEENASDCGGKGLRCWVCWLSLLMDSSGSPQSAMPVPQGVLGESTP